MKKGHERWRSRACLNYIVLLVTILVTYLVTIRNLVNSFSSVEYSRDFWILPSWDKFNFDLSLDNSRSFHWNLISIFDRISYFWSKTDQSCRKNHLPGTVKSNFVGFYILFFVKIGVFSFLTFSFNLERIQENLRRTKPTLYRSMTHFFAINLDL